MCTAALVPTPSSSGFFVVFNRDELTSRSAAEPPRAYTSASGATVVAPRDPDGGGTWIAATNRGEAFGLLNNYRDAERFIPVAPPVSRGVVIAWMTDRAESESLADVFAQREAELPHVRPFRLLALGTTGVDTADEWTWTGVSLLHKAIEVPSVAISSGTKQAQAQAARAGAMTDVVVVDGPWAAVAQRMSEHVPEPGPTAVCMHRRGAQTVSQTVVEVNADEVVMRYKAGAPCVTPEWNETRLLRA